MFLRIFSAAILLALAACSGKSAEEVDANAERIACALNDAKTFTSACALERTIQNGKSTLIIRHPDGSFRRFEVQADGHSLATTDGADAVEVMHNGKDSEITVADDHYLLTAPAFSDVASGSNAPHP
jgi:hypothetical protein